MQNFLDMAENFSVLDPKVGTIYSELPLFNAHVVFFCCVRPKQLLQTPLPHSLGVSRSSVSNGNALSHILTIFLLAFAHDTLCLTRIPFLLPFFGALILSVKISSVYPPPKIFQASQMAQW